MTHVFDSDPAGAVLEYGILIRSDRQHQRRREWERANLKSFQPNVWAGPAMTRMRLVELLEPGRVQPEVRRKLSRVFRTLESHEMIEPSVSDDDPGTLYRVVSILGEELLADGSYLDVIGGLRSVVERWKGSVAMIYGKTEGVGTGFLVRPDAIATAAHVVRGLGGFEVALEGGDALAHVEVTYPTSPGTEEIDVALIRLAQPVASVRPFRLTRGRELLDEVVVFGYPPVPMTKDPHLVVNRGEVSAEIELRSGFKALVVSCLLRGGNSGGPVVNARGHVVGVVSKNLFQQVDPKEQSLNEGLGYAMAVESYWVDDLLAGLL